MHSYKLDKDGAILIFCETAKEPVLFQPTWPNGSEWSDGEAQAWAEQYLLALTDETADLPGDSPEQPTKPRRIIEAEEAPSDNE